MKNKNFIFIFSFFLYLPKTLAQESANNVNLNKIDLTHKNLSSGLYQITNKIDSYFGNEVQLEEKNGSSIQLKYINTTKEFSEASSKPDIKVNVKFKQLQKKFNFKFESIFDDKDQSLSNSQKLDELNQNQNEESALFRASLGFFTEQRGLWNLSMDTGVKIQVPPNPFARVRGQRSFYSQDNIEFRIANKGIIDEVNGLYNYSDMNLYLKTTSRFSFSYTNQFTWKNDLNELITVHGPSVLHEIDDKQLLSYHIKTRFINKPNYAITGHEIFSIYRRDLYKGWFFIDLMPGFSFFSKDDFNKLAFISTKIELNIGDF